MKKRILEVTIASLLGASLAFAENAKVQTNSDRISLFSVPLTCPAAPEIGCGTVAKPVLLELQHQSDIAEAWLKGTGTVLAVVGKHSNPGPLVKTVQSILEKNGITATELNGENREIELKSFVSRHDWYRGGEVDSLTKREAGIIAARLARRVQAKVALSAEAAKALETDLTQAFIDGLGQADETRAAAFKAFQEAIAQGYYPLPEDNEGAKGKVPGCCSTKATTQS
jgi:hypothetical protein